MTHGLGERRPVLESTPSPGCRMWQDKEGVRLAVGQLELQALRRGGVNKRRRGSAPGTEGWGGMDKHCPVWPTAELSLTL